MKKIIAAFSLTAMMGLGFFGYSHTDVDGTLGTEDKGEKTYLVAVEGDVTGSDAEKEVAAKNRAEVLSKLALKLEEGSYQVTYEYDTVFNGFAIKTTPANAEILKNTMAVSDVSLEHRYSQPDVNTTAPVTTYYADGTVSVKEQKLTNYSAETMMARDVDIEGIVNASSKQGEGVTVGILDTGLYLNQVEGTASRTAAENDRTVGPKLNAAAFKDLPEGVTKTFTKENLKTKTNTNFTYINSKIPFAYDYAGSDNDVDPTLNGSEHGTHVASTAVANGDDYKGIAPKAQLAVLKVFGDNGGGASTSAIIAAINDSAKLGLDVINLSLGTDLLDVGESEDSVDNASYKAIKNAADKGVIVNFSAGNAGKSNFSSGDYSDFTKDTVETGILGSDANFDEASNTVASSTPDKAFYSSIMNVKNEDAATASAVSYSDQVVSSSTQTFTKDRKLTDLLGYTEATGISEFDPNLNYFTYDETKRIYKAVAADAEFDPSATYFIQNSTVDKDYYVVPGYGTAADYALNDTVHGGTVGSNVAGKIAVIHRGNTTFVDKVTQATANGAIAAVVINNDPSTTFNFSMAFNDYSPDIPVVFVFQNSTSTWGNAFSQGSMNLMVNSVATAADGNTVSSFSSDGPSSNLDIGPTIAAPGTLIMGAVNATASNSGENAVSYLYGYENLSGTSMAAPNLSGAMVLALGEKKAVTTDDQFAEYKKTLSMKAMSTADQLIDGTKASENSPRMQGSGRINVKSLLTADSYVTVENSDDDGFGNTLQAKAELKNSGSLFVEDGDFAADTDADYVEFDYTIHNDSNVSKTYNASMSVMIPQLRIQVTHDAYAAEEDNSRLEEVGFNSSVTFNADDLETYPTFVGTPTMSVRDDTVTKDSQGNAGYTTDHQGDKTVTVPANSTVTATAKIRIDNLTFKKDWADSKVENFEGTLKEYIAKNFKESAGTFVEGFLKLEETSDTTDMETLTVPYMGFYGDFGAAAAVEEFDFEKETATTYNNGTKYNLNYHINNSDLTDNYLKHLNPQYAKPNAYTGSTINATGTALTAAQINSIGKFETSPLPNGSTFLSVTGSEQNHLYAGAKGVSEYLNVFFFVNRSISTGTYTIKDASGKAVKNGTGSIQDLMPNGTSYALTTTYGLVKSWLTQDENGYAMHRGYASIDLSRVAEGEYTLEFSFTLKGAKKADGTPVVQTKSYPLTVDKTMPELVSVNVSTNSSGTTKFLDIQARGASNTISVGGVNYQGTLVEGSTDVYTTRARLSNSNLDKDKVSVGLTDFAHNEITLLVHPSDLSFSVASTFFTDKHDFIITEIDPANHLYSVEILNKDGETMTGDDMKADFIVYAQLATGLNANDIVVYVDSVEFEDFSYDAATGMLIIRMPRDSVSFAINQEVGKQEGGEGSSSTDSSNTGSSSTTPTDSSSNNSASEGNSSNGENKGGCGGSIIAATSTVGAIALLGAGLALKKKREEK